MPKDEWGVKRICPNCSVRFYDLKSDPMTCPSCDASFDLESLTSTKPKARAAEKAKTEVVAEAPVVDTDDEVDPLEEETSDVDIDDDLLEDDDDDDTVNLEEIADVPGDDDDS